MGCKDGFQNTGIIVKIAFFIVSVSMFCNWLAFTTNSWLRINYSYSYTYEAMGLWRSSSSQLDGYGNTKFGVVQAFGIVGFMSQNVGFLLVVVFMFTEKYRGNREVRLASAGLLIISAIGWLISVAIFGAQSAEFMQTMLETNVGDGAQYLHYSYALAVVACGLGLIGGILMIIGGRGHGNGSVGTK